MAKVTTEIRTIVEGGNELFDFDYPIFDEKYRPVLEKKIIDYYYFREIGLETVAKFKHFLKVKLNMIMPYYNAQYEALNQFKTFDPYINKDLTTTEKRTIESDSTNELSNSGSTESTGSSKEEATGKVIFSDTPSSKLGASDYATNITDSESDSESSAENKTTDISTGTGSSNIVTTEDYLHTIKGFDGMKYASEVYQGVKDVIINIDQMIIDELNELFMSVY